MKRLGLEDKRYGENIRKHKFLVSPEFKLQAKFPVQYQDFEVAHTFLATTDQNTQSRIRRRTQDSVSHFNLTVRQATEQGVKPVEVRRSLGGREYDLLMSQADKSRVSIVKRRRCFLWQNKYYQLDILDEPLKMAGTMILEAYFSKDPGDWDKKLPPFVQVTAEVTSQPKYSMYQMALK